MLALKTSIWSSPCGSFMFALGEACADHFVCKWGGLRPRQPSRFLEAIDACKKEQASSRHHHGCWRLALKTSIWSSPCGSFMFAQGEGCADHFVCKWAGLRPPQPPPLLKAIDACTKKQASARRQHGCWRLALKTSIWSSPCGAFMFALGEGCADHFVCKCGGCAPPEPPAFKGHRCLHNKEQASARRHVDRLCLQ